MAKLFARLVNEMTSFKKLGALHTEWCIVSKKANKAFATIDACLVFDTEGHTLQESTKSPVPNVYIQIPQTITDVLATWTADQVQQFLRSTFYINDKAFVCYLAALGLALRGKNVDGAF